MSPCSNETILCLLVHIYTCCKLNKLYCLKKNDTLSKDQAWGWFILPPLYVVGTCAPETEAAQLFYGILIVWLKPYPNGVIHGTFERSLRLLASTSEQDEWEALRCSSYYVVNSYSQPLTHKRTTLSIAVIQFICPFVEKIDNWYEHLNCQLSILSDCLPDLLFLIRLKLWPQRPENFIINCKVNEGALTLT